MEQPATTIGLCKDCNYSLRGLPANRCPECGREFDPKDPGTMSMGRAVGPIGRFILCSVFWPSAVIVVIPALGLLWLFRLPGPYYMGWVAVPLLFSTLLFSFFLGWELIRAVTAMHLRQPYVHSLASGTGIYILVIALVLMAAILLKFPLHVGFLVSRSALDEFRADIVDNPKRARPPSQRVGLYQLSTTVRYRQDGVLMFNIDGDIESGFGYSEIPVTYAGIAAGEGGQLQGPWYWFSDD